MKLAWFSPVKSYPTYRVLVEVMGNWHGIDNLMKVRVIDSGNEAVVGVDYLTEMTL